MDYLDPKKALHHTIILYVGYVCIAIGIAIGTLILVYQAYGFGIGKNGNVIQSGLVFVSSQPSPATIRIDGKRNKSQTNARLVLPEGIYKILLSRDGYQDWQRSVEVDGGSVQHYDYPLLFPKEMTTKKLASYQTSPGLVTQSPDRRWIVVEQPDSQSEFFVYDLKNPAKAPITISIPDSVVTRGVVGTWALSEWADDNEHFIMTFTQDASVQTILVDRISSQAPVNLTTTLNTTTQTISLKDKKYDQYYVYDKAAETLQTATSKSPTLVPVLEHVLAYKPYRDNTILYATSTNAQAGKVLVKLKVDDRTYAIKTLVSDTNYLLDLTGYDGKLYVVAGAASMNKVYIYKDPIGQLDRAPKLAITPVQVLHIIDPSYLSFSSNAQYIVSENSQQFALYDIENQKGYNYTAAEPIDVPQLHASWMDGNRLAYVSNGKLLAFDFDHTNKQTTIAADPRYLPAYAPDYRFIYTVSPTKTADQPFQLGQSSLLTPADQ